MAQQGMRKSQLGQLCFSDHRQGKRCTQSKKKGPHSGRAAVGGSREAMRAMREGPRSEMEWRGRGGRRDIPLRACVSVGSCASSSCDLNSWKAEPAPRPACMHAGRRDQVTEAPDGLWPNGLRAANTCNQCRTVAWSNPCRWPAQSGNVKQLTAISGAAKAAGRGCEEVEGWGMGSCLGASDAGAPACTSLPFPGPDDVCCAGKLPDCRVAACSASMGPSSGQQEALPNGQILYFNGPRTKGAKVNWRPRACSQISWAS